jgi:hypothetical protein
MPGSGARAPALPDPARRTTRGVWHRHQRPALESSGQIAVRLEYKWYSALYGTCRL